MLSEHEKQCTKCLKTLPFSEFTKHKHGKFGLKPRCKDCTKKYKSIVPESVKKAWIEKNKDKIKIYQKKWYEDNKEKVLDRVKKRSVEKRKEISIYKNEWAKANPDKVRKASKKFKELNPHKSCVNSASRRFRKNMAFPSWANKEKIQEFYHLAMKMSLDTNDYYEVDHIVPLKSDIVCGLHCEFNLRVVHRSINRSKKNKFCIED